MKAAELQEKAGVTAIDVAEGVVCPWCKEITLIKIKDFVHSIWIPYCPICNGTIEDPFS